MPPCILLRPGPLFHRYTGFDSLLLYLDKQPATAHSIPPEVIQALRTACHDRSAPADQTAHSAACQYAATTRRRKWAGAGVFYAIFKNRIEKGTIPRYNCLAIAMTAGSLNQSDCREEVFTIGPRANNPAIGKRTYSVAEIIGILGISRKKAYELCNSGCFKIVRVGRVIRISKFSFDEWLDKQS